MTSSTEKPSDAELVERLKALAYGADEDDRKTIYDAAAAIERLTNELAEERAQNGR